MPIDAATPVDESQLIERLYQKAYDSANRHGHGQVLLRTDLLREKVEGTYTELRDEYAREVSLPEAQTAAFYFVDAVLSRYDRSREAPYKPQPYPFPHERQHTPMDALVWDTMEERRQGAYNLRCRRHNLTHQSTAMTELYQHPFVSFDELAAHALGQPGYRLDTDGGLPAQMIERFTRLWDGYPPGKVSWEDMAKDEVRTKMMEYVRAHAIGEDCPSLESLLERRLAWMAEWLERNPPRPDPICENTTGVHIAAQSSAAKAAGASAVRD